MKRKRLQRLLNGIGIGLALAASGHLHAQTPAFHYTNFSSTADLALHGAAVRVTDRLRLVPAGMNQSGGVWFGMKRALAAGFDTTFQFQIAGAGGGGPGEGFAFVIQNNALPALGPAGGGLGYDGVPNSLAVEFDTFQNTNLADAAANHLSVQTRRGFPNSADHSASLGAVSNSLPAFADGNVHTARILYAPGALQVFIDDLAHAALTVALELDEVLSLDHGQAWFGFTATTSGAAAHHDLLAWSFATADPWVVVTSPANGATFISPANITMAAVVTNPGTVRVEFFQNAARIGEATNVPFSFTWNNVAPGAIGLTAIATDADGLKRASPPVRVNVLPSTPAVGLNFSTGNGGVNYPLAATDLAGVVPQRNWNNLASPAGGNGNVFNLKNGSGTATTMAMAYDFGAPAEDASANASLSPAHRLMKTSLAVGTGTGQSNGTATVSGIPFAVYDVIVYADGDNGGADRVVEIRLGTNSQFLRDAAWAGASSLFTAAGGLVDASAETPAGNCVRFFGLTDNRFVLTVSARSSNDATNRAVMNAIQIVPSILSTAPTTPQLLRGPYLQTGTPTSVRVRWRTDRLVDSRVFYGTDSNALTSAAAPPGLAVDHAVTLADLLPDTRYYYAIGTSGTNFASGPDFSFVTAPARGKPTRVWVIGDSGKADANAAAVRDAFAAFASARPADVWLMLGDNAYPNGTDAEYQAAVFDMYPALLRQCVLWPAIGNHETYAATGPDSFAYLNIFDVPRHGEAGGMASGTEKFYSFNYGNIHFVCLDSMTSDRTTNGSMLAWLEQDLEANTNEWLIAYWHHPPYTKGSHDSDNAGGVDFELVQMREHLLPLLEAHGVDLVLGGHSHSYERSFLLHGHYGLSATLGSGMIKDSGSGQAEVSGAYARPTSGPEANQGAVYVVAGSSSQAILNHGTLDHPAMYTSLLELGSLVLDIDGGRLDAKFLRETGVVEDHFTLLKRHPTPFFRILSVSQTGANVTLTWETVPGRTYFVERTDSLISPDWAIDSEPLVASGPSLTWSHPRHSLAPAVYFRIQSEE